MSRAPTMLLAAVLLVSGCTPADDEVAGQGATDAEASDAADVVTPFDEGIDPMRVLLAIIVLTTGSVDAAVAEGLVTPEELDIADSAIANGEVSAWLARADLTLNGG